MKIKAILGVLLATVLIFNSVLVGGVALAKSKSGGNNKKAAITINKTKVKKVKAAKTEVKENKANKKDLQTVTTTETETEEDTQDTDEVTEDTDSDTDTDTEEENEENESVTLRRVKNGAQFTYNSETGVVTLTTPSGNTKTLNLPQRAIDNMFRNAEEAVEEDEDTEEGEEEIEEGTEVEEEETEDGETLVSQEVTEDAALLGLIPVEKITKITINTDTGEVIEAEPSTFIDWLLDKLTI